MKPKHVITLLLILAACTPGSIPPTSTSAPPTATRLPILTPKPVDVEGLASRGAAIATGGHHTCVLTTSGGIKCWGCNWSGQLGDGTTTDRSTPVGVEGLMSGVVAISAGSSHTCALTTSGGVKCWGENGEAQLGDGTMTDHSTPVDVVGLASGVIAISAGNRHTCALTTSGGVKCWGTNWYPEQGNWTKKQSGAPVDVAGLSKEVAAIAAGYDYTCALTTDGGAKCWGWNEPSQLGDGTGISRSMPVDVVGLSSGVKAIAADTFHTCALTIAGGVKCWGENSRGQLGDGTTTDHNTPVDVVELPSGVAAIAIGGGFTCALTTGNGVKCWGFNVSGQSGDGTTIDRGVPVDVEGLSSGVAAIATGHSHVCVLTTDGGVKCWGYNDNGQLGDGTMTSRSIPVDVVGFQAELQPLPLTSATPIP